MKKIDKGNVKRGVALSISPKHVKGRNLKGMKKKGSRY